MENRSEILENLVLELRRGIIVLSVLSQLDKQQYGYSLVQSLEDKGLSLDPGTLYPLLRRLEKQNLLTSEWETSGNKPRKYYILSKEGKEIYKLLQKEWMQMTKTINEMLKN